MVVKMRIVGIVMMIIVMWILLNDDCCLFIIIILMIRIAMVMMMTMIRVPIKMTFVVYDHNDGRDDEKDNDNRMKLEH